MPFSQLSNPSQNTASHSDAVDSTDEVCESSEMVMGLSQEQFNALLDHIQTQVDFDDEKTAYITHYLSDNNVCIDTEQALAFVSAIHFSNTKIQFIEQLLPYIIDWKVGKKRLVNTIGFYNDKIKVKKLISEHLKRRKIDGTFMNPQNSQESSRFLQNDNSTELDSFANGKPKQRGSPNYQGGGTSEYYTKKWDTFIPIGNIFFTTCSYCM